MRGLPGALLLITLQILSVGCENRGDRAGMTRPGQARSGQARSDQAKSDQARPGQALPADPSGMSLATHPDPPIALQKTTFLVTVVEPEGSRPPSIVLDLSMPGMYHGANRPPCIRVDRGEHLCVGYFVMGGIWEIVVEIEGEHARTFDVTVVE